MIFFIQIFSYIIRIIRVLNDSKVSPRQFSIGFLFGIYIASNSFLSFYSISLLFFLLILNISFRAAILSIIFFTPISFLISPFVDFLGEFILSLSSLQTFFQNAYYSFWLITGFNNTYNMGVFAFSILTALPFYFFCKFFIRYYRRKLKNKILNLPIFRKIIKNKLISFVLSKIE